MQYTTAKYRSPIIAFENAVVVATGDALIEMEVK